MTDLERLRAALADRYRVEEVLGQGGMATVYLAHDLKHGRRVAIKVLPPDLASLVGVERFLREIQIEARLQHVNILPLHDSGEASGFVYYVMPFVEGESLRDRLAREKQLKVDEAIGIAREIADALGYAHSRGVIHRDVKPENILLSDGHAVLADFGIARAIDVAGGKRVTESGHSIGTPLYMSPEQATGELDLDGRTDIYSLACVLFEMLAGEPPFGGRTPKAIIAKHVMEPPPSLDVFRPALPAPIKAAIETALAKTPADRFQSTGEFMAVIASAMQAERPELSSGEAVREAPRSVYGTRTTSRAAWLFREARRRYLPQVGLVYLVFAWVVMDAVKGLVDSRDAGPWLLPLVLALLVAGLPLVLAVVWIHKPVSGEAAGSHRGWRRWVERIRAGHVMSLLGVAAFAILLARQTPVATDDAGVEAQAEFPPTRIAVLPFDDASPGRDFGHLATVLPDYLTRQLSQLDALSVVPYSAVRRFAADTLVDVAKAVGAGTVIEGTVIGSGNEVRLTVNLTDANKLALLHSAEYRKPRDAPLALLDTLTNDVVRSLRRELGVVVRDLERMAGTDSDEAWEQYAHGREWATNADDLWKAGRAERALQTYARADSAFARAEGIDPAWIDPIVERGWVRYQESEIRAPTLRTRDTELLQQGLVLAARALALDSLNVRALDLRGTLYYWLGQMSEGREAERLHQQAEGDLLAVTAMDSTNAHAWHRLSSLYSAQGRHADAKTAAVRALHADQYYEEREAVYSDLCDASLNTQQWEEFTRWCQAGFQEFPRSKYIFNLMAMGLSSPGGPEPDVGRIWKLRDDFLEASPPLERAQALPTATLYVAMVLARAGLPDSARAVIRSAQDAASEPEPFFYYNEAHARLLLGERERALDLLERYVEARPTAKRSLPNDWWFESLHSEPRFQRLVQ